MLDIHVVGRFHRLRLRELELAARHLQRLNEEREAERERKAQLREERRVQDEIRKEQERLQKERTHYLNSIAALEAMRRTLQDLVQRCPGNDRPDCPILDDLGGGADMDLYKNHTEPATLLHRARAQ